MNNDASRPLAEGDLLPELELRDQNGQPVRFADYRGSTLILYFYPFDNGLGCKTQACSIRDNWALFRNGGVEVFGINSSSVDSHRGFHERHSLPFPLLVDDGKQLARHFGFVHDRSLLGKDFASVERSTVIVDPDGTIRAVLRKVKPHAHFDMLRVELQLPPAPPPVEDVADEPTEDVDDVVSGAEDPAA
jgi:peroxiredoxin Q/BCP